MRRGIAFFVVALAIVVGCGSGGDDDSSPSQAASIGRPSDGATTGGAAPAPAAVPSAVGNDQDESVLLAQTAGRQIIFTAKLQVEVTDVFSAAAEAKRLASTAGGFFFSERSVVTETSTQPQSEITFKLPPASFGSVMDDLARLGREREGGKSTPATSRHTSSISMRD